MTIRTLTIAAALITTVAVASTVTTYTVKKGDSLNKIADRFGVSIESLRSANRLKNSNHLKLGQVIQIPSTAPHTDTLGKAEILVDKIQPHAGPFDGSKKLDAVVKGGEARALAEKPGWVKLQLSTGIGWLPTSAVKLTSAVPLAESITAASKPALAIVKPKKKTLVASNTENPILKSAFGYKGVRYRWGGMSRSSGVDCSGFTSSVFRSQGISLPRTALEQSRVGDAVSKSGLQAGDLIFFRTNRSVRVNHVGIYIGEGKFIHAATSAGHVMVSSLSDPYYVRAYAAARRVADFNAAARASRILVEATEL